jgi:6-phosphogluconolactonase (cycloisomerase 2 family)
MQETAFTFKNPVENAANKTLLPYIHQTIIDPTQTFLLAPDLSADLIHVFSIDSTYILQRMSSQTDISVPKRHGPRHGVFYQPGNGSNATYLYMVMETANIVHGYSVTYNNDKTLNFTIIQYLQLPVPTIAAAAEIKLTVRPPLPKQINNMKLIKSGVIARQQIPDCQLT